MKRSLTVVREKSRVPSTDIFDDVGVASSTVFQKIRAGAGFKTGDFATEKIWGGLPCRPRGDILYSSSSSHPLNRQKKVYPLL